MTRKGGRPKSKPDDGPGSRLVRVHGDVGVMLSWITRITGESSAQYLDPLVRRQITADFAHFYPQLLALKLAEDAAAEAAGNEPGEPLPPCPGVGRPDAPEPAKPKRKKP